MISVYDYLAAIYAQIVQAEVIAEIFMFVAFLIFSEVFPSVFSFIKSRRLTFNEFKAVNGVVFNLYGNLTLKAEESHGDIVRFPCFPVVITLVRGELHCSGSAGVTIAVVNDISVAVKDIKILGAVAS